MEHEPKAFDAVLKDLGFKAVEPQEVKRVEDSVTKHVVEPISDELGKSQEALEEARTWYVG